MSGWFSKGRVFTLSWLALVVSPAFGGPVFAQARLNLLPTEPIKVNVDLVTFSFSVKDKSQRYVKNLSKEDVVLWEDDVSQDIVFFDSENVPLSVVLLVDASESTGPLCKEMEAASRIVADVLRSEDETAVIMRVGPGYFR